MKDNYIPYSVLSFMCYMKNLSVFDSDFFVFHTAFEGHFSFWSGLVCLSYTIRRTIPPLNLAYFVFLHKIPSSSYTKSSPYMDCRIILKKILLVRLYRIFLLKNHISLMLHLLQPFRKQTLPIG